jgi:hypothetical protein
MIRFSLLIAGFALVTSCRNTSNKPSSNNHSSTAQDTVENVTHLKVDEFALVEPTKKIIYYMSEVDITTYDSIATNYFHAVMDYTDSTAIQKETNLNYLQGQMNSDTITSVEKEVISNEITELTIDLLQYEKVVTGYVFVHTFLNKGDTLSAIIVTNANMSKGEAYPVNKVTYIEPSEYTNNVRRIEQ